MLPLAPRGHIILDSIETWPTSIRDILASEEAQLRSYVAAERMYNKRLTGDVMLRLQRWTNPYEFGWQETARRVRELAEAHLVVSFHCTRLIPEDIDDIRADGLRPLSRASTCKRVDRLLRKNLLSPDLAAALKRPDDSPGAKLARREGLISLFHCLSTLRGDESGLYRLLRYWGGEAVYGHHEGRSPEIMDALSRIGTPCIVVATLQPSDVRGYTPTSFEERLMRVWLDRGTLDADSQDCVTQVRNRSVPVFDVIEYADPRFEQLTGYSQWCYRIDSQ